MTSSNETNGNSCMCLPFWALGIRLGFRLFLTLSLPLSPPPLFDPETRQPTVKHGVPNNDQSRSTSLCTMMRPLTPFRLSPASSRDAAHPFHRFSRSPEPLSLTVSLTDGLYFTTMKAIRCSVHRKSNRSSGDRLPLDHDYYIQTVQTRPTGRRQ